MSNEIDKIDNQYDKISNEIGKIGNHYTKMSSEIGKIGNQYEKRSNHPRKIYRHIDKIYIPYAKSSNTHDPEDMGISLISMHPIDPPINGSSTKH